MPDRQIERGPRGRWGQFSRTASFWILMFLIPLLIYQVASPRKREVSELPYSAFRDQLEGNNIEKVTIIDGKRVEGTLRAPVPGASGRQVKDFWTLLPFKDNADAVLAELETKNVPIRSTLPRQNWWA